jgi:hypothetical protein
MKPQHNQPTPATILQIGTGFFGHQKFLNERFRFQEDEVEELSPYYNKDE